MAAKIEQIVDKLSDFYLNGNDLNRDVVKDIVVPCVSISPIINLGSILAGPADSINKLTIIDRYDGAAQPKYIHVNVRQLRMNSLSSGLKLIAIPGGLVAAGFTPIGWGVAVGGLIVYAIDMNNKTEKGKKLHFQTAALLESLWEVATNREDKKIGMRESCFSFTIDEALRLTNTKLEEYFEYNENDITRKNLEKCLTTLSDWGCIHVHKNNSFMLLEKVAVKIQA